MSYHFCIYILPGESPFDGTPFDVAAKLPAIDFGDECGPVRQTPISISAILSQLACFGVV
jgi:hypothetical protein